MNEIFFIKKSIKLIEKKTQWGDYHSWSNYHFNKLCVDIQAKTNDKISVSTLKRYFGKKKTPGKNYNPQIFTKDTIARFLDYNNWEDFKTKNQIPEDTDENNRTSAIDNDSSNKKMYRISGISFILILSGFFTGYLLWRNKKTEVVFYSHQPTGLVPYTAKFHYDISGVKDTVYIDFGNNNTPIVLPKNNHVVTDYYKAAGRPVVKIYTKEKLLDSAVIHNISKKWQCGFSKNDSIVTYRPFENQQILLQNKRLFVPRDSAEKLTGELQDYFIEYRFTDTFDVVVDNMNFETVVKNCPRDGGRRCYDIEIILLGQYSKLQVRFLEPGCYRYVRLQFGEKHYFGRFTDLSQFSRDVTQWRKISIQVKQQQAKVFFEGEEIFNQDYNRAVGELKGIIYRFYGTGSVKNCKITGPNRLIFHDNFQIE